MANICDQNLYVFAATGDDMKTLLAKMAENFKKTTDIDVLSGVDASADWKAYAREMASSSQNYNMLCFLTAEPDSRAEAGWFNSGENFGKPYIVINMGLKWGPSYQVAEFCNALDSSKYGYACINGGEYMCAMGDEIAYIQWGEDFGSPSDGGLEYEEFADWGNTVRSKSPTTLHEMALRELFELESAGTFFWEHADDEDGVYYSGGYSMGYMDAYSVDWRNPSARDLSSIDNAITQVLEKFPWVIGVTGSAYEGREENVEGLVPGDLVKILANWNSPYFNPCALEVYTADGRSIGNLDNIWGEAMQLEDIERTAIACILPHIKAYAEIVEPLSTKDGRSRHSKVTVRLEVNDQSLASIFDEVHALLKKSIGKRDLTSDLEGAK